MSTPRQAKTCPRCGTMTLPPPVARPDRERVPSAEEDFPAFDPEASGERLNGPAVLMAVVIALLLFAFVWWFVRQM